MTRAGGFLIRLATGQNHPLLVGGLCAPGWEGIFRESSRQLAELSFTGEESIVSVDRKLAEAVEWIATPELWAVGLSIELPGYGERTGGVLGSPHQAPASAAGQVESLGHDLWMMTRPGGPGIVVQGTEEELHPLLTSLEKERTPSLAKWAGQMGKRGHFPFLIVSDGCASDGGGEI